MSFASWVFALLAAAGSADDARPTVAVAPGRAEGGADAWLGLALADNVTTRLLIHSRFEPRSLERVYPLNVLGWRQVAAAARGEGVDVSSAGDDNDSMQRVAEQLGADDVLVLSYEMGAQTASVHWHLIGGPKSSAGQLEARLEALTPASEKLAAVVLEALGQDAAAVGGHKLEVLPLAALKPYGMALAILGRQSLDPRAHLVLPPAELRRAHQLLSAATDAAPNFARAWVERGIASSMLGNLAGAENELVQAMAQSGEFEPSAALGLYYFYERQQRHGDAIKALEEAAATHLGFLQGLGYLAEAYARAGMGHEALQTYTSYTARVPKSPWAKLQRAAALARLGKHTLAVEESQALRRRFPTSVMVLTSLASRQIDAHDLNGASATLAEAAKLAPKHPVVLARQSYLALEKGQIDKALELARAAVAAVGDGRGAPLAGYAHLNLAHALALSGRRAEALKALVRARELGVGAEDARTLTRDPRLRELLADPLSPFVLAP
jgi:tetratricopeptide (TPR) repeat protein